MPTKEKQLRRIKPESPGGFRDYGPQDAIARRTIIRTIETTFEDFGFDPMETPAVERTEVLTGGEKESKKMIFSLTNAGEKKSDTSLRFDLTVPLARFIAANPEIPKPFRRYQIGLVWRGESPQAGRYREFLQADIDIVGSSRIEADADIIATIAATLKRLDISNFLIRINNRKILDALPAYANFPQKKLWDVLRIIDKRDKIGDGAMKKELTKLIGKSPMERIAVFIESRATVRETIAAAKTMYTSNAQAEEGIRELAETGELLGLMGVPQENWCIDFSVVRGLAYYTGMVFETILREKPEIGSIVSGGRYDNLAIPFTGEKLCTVGGSIGIDRLYTALDLLGVVKKKSTNTQALVMNLSDALGREYITLTRTLRETGINASLYLGDDRAFQAQLTYALKKEIPFVVIFGDEEEKKSVVAIKNLATRQQQEIPKADLVKYFKKI